MTPLSRRDFIKMTALGTAALAGGGALGACGRDSGSGDPAAATSAKPAGPRWPGRVVRAIHPGVWRDRQLDPAALHRLLDASVVQLTGAPDRSQGWRALFNPGERVAIKVNSIPRGSSHVALALAAITCLREAGVKPEDITLFDWTTDSLNDAGFPVNRSGAGVRCHGTDGNFSGGWSVGGKTVRLSRILTDCDALINIPILKAFTEGGISFALKNHYGSFDIPSDFHGRNFTAGAVGVNGLAPIRDKTRLVIGDILSWEARHDVTHYAVVGGASTLLLSADPLAHDRVGVQAATEAFSPSGANVRSFQMQADGWLAAAAALGLGEPRPEKLEIKEVRLG
jgi:hypothetical protein